MTVSIDSSTAAANLAARLRRSVDRQAAIGATRFTRQPWKAPSAHATTTVYEIGDRVVNASNIYTCITAGTSGGASPPTGTGNALISDGTVSWMYVGPTFSDDPLVPTISIANSAPALGRFYRNASSSFSSGAATVISNDNWYEYWGSQTAPSSSGFTGGQPDVGLAFMTDAININIAKTAAVIGGNQFGLAVEIDGRRLTGGMWRSTFSSGTDYYSIVFPDRRARRVVIRWNNYAVGTALKGVYCDATATIWKPPTNLKALLIGDSFGVTYKDGFDGAIPHYATAEIGIDNFFMNYVSGSGFVAGTPYTNATRLGYITTYQPDIIIAQGSVNDASGSVAAAIASWYASVRSAVGNKPWIFITGVMGRNSAETATEAAMRVQIASMSDPLNRLVFLPASGDASGPWATGTGTVAAPAGNGNGDVYWGPDGVHPLARGQWYLGRRIGEAIQQAMGTR